MLLFSMKHVFETEYYKREQNGLPDGPVHQQDFAYHLGRSFSLQK